MDITPPSFEDRYIPEPNSGCWLWEGYVDKGGYGKIKRRGQYYRAHRFSWVVHRGEIPEGIHVLHHCDTPSCVNPDHLFLGTAADNHQDRRNKGRKLREQDGENNSMAKLTVKDVLAIRADPRSNRQIAEDYGVQHQAIQKIKNHRRWAYAREV